MSILLECWIEDDDTGAEVSRLLHDVEKVVGLDPSFGGACRDSRVTGNQTVLSEEMNGRAAVLVDLDVIYGHQDTDPSSQR